MTRRRATAAVRAAIYGTVIALLAMPQPVFGYRPFVSTDAAVVDVREVEIELGYFTLARTQRQNTFATPGVVANYGFVRNWEVVAEFRVEASPDFEITDPGVFLKSVLKEGVLQEKRGISVAVEAGPLLPSTQPGERGVGLEGVGIVSASLAPVTVHVNAGGGIERAEARPFALWGIIGELPVHPRFRVAGEVNGESTRGESPNNSVLLGFIRQPTSSKVFFDAAIRRGISSGAPDWQATAGVTFGVSPPSFSRRLSP